jgi:tRNA modification GTPase
MSDTIAAIATPAGMAGIGIVRVSGPLAITVFKNLTNQSDITPRHAYFLPVTNGENKVIDRGVCIYFKGPNSYTGLDVVEFQLHGSPALLKAVLLACLSQGARLADRGEFTQQAFINGKLSLSQAESVMDIIEAQTQKAGHIALNQLEGALHKKIGNCRQTLMILLEQLEGSIDFPDEVPAMDKNIVRSQVQSIQELLTKTLNNQDFGKWIKTGINCLIVGLPNAGKSSLLNQLAGEDRALVSNQAGTTRDFIDLTIELDGYQYNLTDTAGLREQADAIEAMGIKKVEKLIQQAHLVLWVIDGHSEPSEPLLGVWERIKHKDGVVLINKSDLPLHGLAIPNECTWPNLNISTLTVEGVDGLKHYLMQNTRSKTQYVDTDMLCNVRQVDCLKKAEGYVSNILDTLNQNAEDDMIAFDLKQAILSLGELTGDDVTEEVLDGIFGRFCVGK